MSNYTNGRAREYAVCNALRAVGYNCRRSAGSHSPVDVTADKDGDTIYIQVKYNCKIEPDELETFKNYPCAKGIRKELWTYHKGRKEPEICQI